MKDLEPYMCTFGDCIRADKTYGVKRDWKQHELDVHRTSKFWSCRPCGEVFDTKDGFEAHIQQRHPALAGKNELRIITEYCENRKEIPISEISCPLCLKSFSSHEQVLSHIADDLEQLALFALPAGSKLDEQNGLDLLEDSGSDGEWQKEQVDLPVPDNADNEEEAEPSLQYVREFIAAQSVPPATGSRTQQEKNEQEKPIPTIKEPSIPLPGPRKPTVEFPVNTMVYPRFEHFYGQVATMAHLHSQMQHPGLTCTIHGVGGVGKTILAVEYAYRFGDEYDCIFWLQADTEPGLTESHCLIASSLGMLEGHEDQAQIIEIGRDWLETTGKSKMNNRNGDC